MQRLRRLLRQRNIRRADRAFVVEGAKLLDVALRARSPMEAVYYAPGALTDPFCQEVLERAAGAGCRTFALQAGVLERVADTVNPQPVLGVVGFVDTPLTEIVTKTLLAVLIDVRDPGNLGAIIRSADAAGFGGIVASAETADCYNPKCVRASAGSLFRIPLALGGSAEAILRELGDGGFRRVGAVSSGGSDYATTELSGQVALVFGNEAQGLSRETAALLDEKVSIPMADGAESLNVAMAATVLMFECTRRKRLGQPAAI